MASNYYTPSDSTDKPEFTLPTFHLHHTAPNGREFSYTVIRLTLQCYLMEADHTGATRQFPTAASLHKFWSALKRHLNTVHAMKLLPAPRIAGLLTEPQRTENAIPMVALVEDAEYSHPVMPVPATIAFNNELVKISGQYTDRGAFHRALMIAREMLENGEWDGKTELWIDDPYAKYNKVSAPVTPIPGLAQPQIAKSLAPRNERTGREIHTTNQQIAADLMAQYPEAKTPSEAAQMRLDAFIAARKAAPKPAAQPVSTSFAPVQKAAGF